MSTIVYKDTSVYNQQNQQNQHVLQGEGKLGGLLEASERAASCLGRRVLVLVLLLCWCWCLCCCCAGAGG
jgi:hypothetical protein